jgi:hypothetical protein
MGAMGDLRSRLREIHGMMPLSEREKKLASWVLHGDGETDITSEVRDDPNWWGKEALEVIEALER